MKKLMLLFVAGVALFVFGSVSPIIAAYEKPLARPVAKDIQIKGDSICMTWETWCPKDDCATPGKAIIMKRSKKLGSKAWSVWKTQSQQDPNSGEYCYKISSLDRGKTWEFKIVFKKSEREQTSKWYAIDINFQI
ncbi:MAG: hypothetical protein BWK80_03545 [Desulfobacteraceae bacterium IS3]|nr:MAG: hypothetical protein BWK80_03545 [Desulfobacteraceae bacterium IS3]